MGSQDFKNKKINYSRLIKDTYQLLKPKNLSKNLYKWLTKDIAPQEGLFDIKKKGSTNQKIIFWLCIPDNIDSDLSSKDLKILCNVLNYPYQENKEKLVEEIKSYIYKSKSLFPDVILKYLEKLSIKEIENLSLVEDFNLSYYDYEDIDNKHSEIYRRNSFYYLIKKKFNKNVVRVSSFEKRFQTGNLEYKKIFEKFLVLYSAILSSDSLSREIDNLTKNIFQDTDNPYKFAVDEKYNLNKSEFGGPYHRLHDESHTIGGMLEKIKNTKPNDTQSSEFLAFINEYAKDLQTTMGLPIINISKSSFDELHSFIKPLGISKSDLYDFATYNLQEALNVVFLITYYLFPSTRKDKEKLGYVYGLLSTVGVFGNPLAIVALAIVMIVSIIKKDFKDKNEKEKIIKGAFKGAGITLLIKLAIGILDIDSISEMIGFLIAICMVVLLVKKSKKKIYVSDLSSEIKKRLSKLKDLTESSLPYYK